jgi:RNA polymerase sigma factor (sigma-70 family)
MADSSLQSVLRFARRMAEPSQKTPAADVDLLNQFSIENDERAFAILVQRHGSMVWGVCRRLLGGIQDAEDCFQAVFLVLARKAHTLNKGDSLGAWLHRIAYRLASRSRASTGRRRTEEGRAAAMSPHSYEREETWEELRGILDQEIEQLPLATRVPLVLCYLQGKSNSQVAKELGLPLGTVKGRLARGRELLRDRLEKRGLTLSTAVLAALITEQAASGMPPGMLLVSIASAARAFASGRAVAISDRALALAKGMLQATILDGVAKSALIAVFLSVATGGTVLFAGSIFLPEKGANGTTRQVLGSPVQNVSPERVEKSAREPKQHTDLLGDPLPIDAVSRLGTSRLRHGWDIRSVLVTPNGKNIVSKGTDGVRVWELDTGKQVHAFAWEMAGHKSPKVDRGLMDYAGLSGDGRLFAFQNASEASTIGIELYDVQTEKRLATIGKEFYVGATLSYDGKLIACIRSDARHVVDMIDVATDKTVWSAALNERVPPDLTRFSPDGETFVMARAGLTGGPLPSSPSKCCRVIDVKTGKDRFSVELSGLPLAIAISPDNRQMAVIIQATVIRSGLITRDIHIWDLVTGKEKLRIDPPLPPKNVNAIRSFTALCFLPDSKTLLTSGYGDELIQWDLITGKERRRLGEGMANASDLALTPNGGAVVVSHGKQIGVLDFETGRPLHPELKLPTADAIAVARGFSSDGATVATSNLSLDSSPESVVYWDTVTGRERRRVEIPRKGVTTLTSDGNKAIIAPAFQPKSLILRDLAIGKETELSATYDREVTPALSDSGKLVAVADQGNAPIQIIESESGKRIHTLSEPGMTTRQLLFSQDETRLFAFSPDQTVRIWDLSQGRKIRQYTPSRVPDTRPRVVMPNLAKQNTPAYARFLVALSPDGKLIASSDYRSYVLVRNAEDGLNSRRFDVSSRVYFITFSSDSKLLAWASLDDSQIHLIEVASGKEVHTLAGHRGFTQSLVFSADGQRCVSGNTDGTAIVWDLSKVTRGLR